MLTCSKTGAPSGVYDNIFDAGGYAELDDSPVTYHITEVPRDFYWYKENSIIHIPNIRSLTLPRHVRVIILSYSQFTGLD